MNQQTANIYPLLTNNENKVVNTKIIINLIILGISAILFSWSKACNRLKDFSHNQDKNPDLIGEFLNLNDNTIWEFRNNGELYGFKLEDKHKSF